ncbi:MAG TPA: hypothetical protein VFG34_01190 [Sphingopyxis sp.]|nr:hypothetical protein [Sphingopyxis sp.]
MMSETTPDIAALFATVFRDFVDDGVIASGVYQPEKTLLRQLGIAIADALAEKASKDLATAAAAGLLSPQLAAKLAGIADEANKYVHPTTDGSRHLPVTGAGDTARWLKSGAAAGAMAQWAVISKADIGLGQADNTPDALKPVSNATQAALNAKEDKSGKGAAGGYASLDAGGKIPSSQLPPIAISEPFVVASQAAMLALVAQTGDFAIRTDVSRTYILREEPASALVNWVEMATPAQGVMAVNDKPGPNVDISKADVGLGQADNTPDAEKPVSNPQQQALDAKADKAVKISAGEGLSGGGDLSANRALSLSADALAALTKANSAVQPDDLGDLADVDFPASPGGRVLNDLGEWVLPGTPPEGGGGSGGQIQFDMFKTSGTYTKPEWAKTIEVYAVGGGGGGGGGAAVSEVDAPLVAYGGGGGGGGGLNIITLDVNDVGLNVTVSVGSGGSGGATVRNPGTSATLIEGKNGANGGHSSFGTYVYATGGWGGLGGTSSGGIGGAGGGARYSSTSMNFRCPYIGGDGASASLASNLEQPAWGVLGAPGGGAGGSVFHDEANPMGRWGRGSFANRSSWGAYNAFPAAPGSEGVDASAPSNSMSGNEWRPGIASGGGSARTGGTASQTAGSGAASFGGAGGGGGGAIGRRIISGTALAGTSGSGGRGGAGHVLVITRG